MAATTSRLYRALPILTGATILGAAGTIYITTRRPLLLDSPRNAPQNTLSFPSSMLFSKELTVTKVDQVNHDTKRITFALPGGKNEVSGVRPGAAILTQHTPTGAWFPVLRPYTPISDADEPGVLQLLIKQYPNGRASTYMHSLAPGQTLRVRGPLPGYTHAPSPTPRTLLLIAGGAGITPLYSLTRGILADARDEQTRVQLVWGVNGTRDIVLRDELESLEQRYPDRLHVTYVVSGPEGGPDAPSLGDEAKYRKGYVDRAVVEDAIRRCQSGGAGSWDDVKGTKVFVCGPPKMEEAVAGKAGVLAELGVSKKAVHRF